MAGAFMIISMTPTMIITTTRSTGRGDGASVGRTDHGTHGMVQSGAGRMLLTDGTTGAQVLCGTTMVLA